MVACAGASIDVSDATSLSLDWPLSLGDAVGSSPCVGPVEGVRSSLGSVEPGFVGAGCVGFGDLGSEVDGSEVVGAGSAGAVPAGSELPGAELTGAELPSSEFPGALDSGKDGMLDLRSESSEATAACAASAA